MIHHLKKLPAATYIEVRTYVGMYTYVWYSTCLLNTVTVRLARILSPSGFIWASVP